MVSGMDNKGNLVAANCSEEIDQKERPKRERERKIRENTRERGRKNRQGSLEVAYHRWWYGVADDG